MSQRRQFLALQLFVLLGAMLLFGMEPLIGKLLLPSCGGSFHVWATCLMFFQGALFLGYLYCHLLTDRLGRWHLVVLLLPLAFLPIGRGLSQLHPDPHDPALATLGALIASIAVPFVVLSTTGVVAQRWLARSDLPERNDPYRLFAASNAGSLLGLLGYPLLVEPLLGLQAQRVVWSVGFLGFLVLALRVAPRRQRASEALGGEALAATPSQAQGPDLRADPRADPEAVAADDRRAGARSMGLRDLPLWFLLSFAPSACLMAVTNVIAIDLGSAPLVWVIPLSLYLVSFILTFGVRTRYPWVVRSFWPEAVALGLLLWFVRPDLGWSGVLVQLVVLSLVCWVGHAELYRSRPAAQHLTAFYLCVSLGGWMGGVFVALLAPALFDGLAEYPVAVGTLALTLLVARRRELVAWARSAPRLRVVGSLVLLGLVASEALTVQLVQRRGLGEVQVRNVYGIYRVIEQEERSAQLGVRKVRQLLHGTTVHGKELVDSPGVPIGFFHAASPLGEALRTRPRPEGSEALRVAIVGLGTGALAGHLREGDQLDFYELDPEVVRLAEEHFSYLARTPAAVRHVLGDARLNLTLGRERYDVILVDAFSSDSIPSHLLTREALALYLGRLRPGGLLAFHVSNRYYDLRPVLAATARALDPSLVLATRTTTDAPRAPFEDPTTAVVVGREAEALRPLVERGWRTLGPEDGATVTPWSDDYANLLAPLWARLRELWASSPAR